MECKIELFTRPDEIKLREMIREEIENLELVRLDLDIEVGVWPKRVRVSDSRSWDIIDNYQRYRDWAEKNGLELYPAFKRQLVENNYTDETYEEIIFPIASVAIYENSNIEFVFPSGSVNPQEEIIYKVGDFINLLKNKEIDKKLRDTNIQNTIKQTIEKDEIEHKNEKI